ncbi:MAG: terminase family protein [Desulfovibrio sp.]|jgi:hypothetical protein|nr:terminase family protein [Desulfovibrio sp.]
MAELTVEIPYTPRPVQRKIHTELEAFRFCVLVAHRRMGKTVLAVNQLIKRAFTDGKQNGSYGYIAPFRNQAKEIAWAYLKRYTAPIPDRDANESELSILLPNGSRIRLFGADNPDALRGMYFDGVILDEVAQMKREVWDEIIQPALADRKGWAVFIGTPKGINLFFELYSRAQQDPSGEWAAMLYRVTDTDSLDEAEIDRLRREMSENAFRQELLCDFAASSDDILIPLDLAIEASRRVKTERDAHGLPVVLGVDVARFGSDASVFFRRAGLVSFHPLVLRGKDNMEVADRLLAHIHEHNPNAVFIDAGQGQGVIDRVRQLGARVTEIPFGSKAMEESRFANRRAEMWYAMREWLQAGGAIPDDSRLISELSAPTYSFNPAGKIQLEPKEKIVERLGFSPDLADALALTFAAPVAVDNGLLPRKTRCISNKYED